MQTKKIGWWKRWKTAKHRFFDEISFFFRCSLLLWLSTVTHIGHQIRWPFDEWWCAVCGHNPKSHYRKLFQFLVSSVFSEPIVHALPIDRFIIERIAFSSNIIITATNNRRIHIRVRHIIHCSNGSKEFFVFFFVFVIDRPPNAASCPARSDYWANL